MALTRRTFLRLTGAAPLALTSFRGQAQPAVADPWARAEEILRRIVPPVFPPRDFEITHFGAVGDGRADCTAAIRKAIDACTAAGGGRVVVPDGVFLTGAIHLKSNVNLHVSAKGRDLQPGCPAVPADRLHAVGRRRVHELLGPSSTPTTAETSPSPAAARSTARPTPGTGGTGVGRGGAARGSPTARKPRRPDGDGVEEGVLSRTRVFGEGRCLRPNFVQPYSCENVLIEGVTILNSPMWEIHPVLCRNVTVRNVTDQQPRPEQRRLRPRVLPRRPHRRLHLRHRRRLHRHQVGPQRRRPADRRARRRTSSSSNCTMKDGHGGVMIGSEIAGRRAQRLRALPHGQPESRPRPALQDQLHARRA